MNGTEWGPSHAGARYSNHGRTAVKGPCRRRKSPHPGPTYRSGAAFSPSVPESLFPLGVPIVPGVEASLPGSAMDADPRGGWFEGRYPLPVRRICRRCVNPAVITRHRHFYILHPPLGGKP
jgi:hypothetical protein